jgi:type I restriction enzyme R subunit
MVVTANIETAITYYQAIIKKLDELGNPFKAIIAFSGKKEIKGIEYTEDSINGFASKDISEKFDTDEYRLLVVANKFLTGFDQPKLCAMYVDKKLQGVLAVQALSRLNRSSPKYGKKTEDLFVLDFFNKVEDIKASFDPFYTSTTLSEETDINVLHELKDNLDDLGVYEQSEVDVFFEKYFRGVEASELSVIIDVAAQRFNKELGLEDGEKADYKIKAKQFVKIYGQMASIMPYEIIAWEKLFWFLKFLIPKMIIKDKDKDALDELLNSVDLSTYGLERVKLSTSIGLDESETELDPQNPNPRGAHGSEEEKDPLDDIIKTFNERWFHGWEATPEEQRVKFVNLMEKVKTHDDYKSKYEENKDEHTRRLALEKMVAEIMNRERRKELELYKLFAGDEAFRTGMLDSFERALRVS